MSGSERVPMGALVRLCRPSWYTGNALREPAPAYACLYLSISAHSASPAPLSVTCPPTDSRISYSGPRASPAIDRSSLVPTWRWMTPFAPSARSGLLARRSFPGLSPSSARREGPAPWHYVPGSLMVPWPYTLAAQPRSAGDGCITPRAQTPSAHTTDRPSRGQSRD